MKTSAELKIVAEDRDATIHELRKLLKERTGRAWSVTGGRGTAWGWIKIDAPPTRRTWGFYLPEGMADIPENYRERDMRQPGRCMSPDDKAVLAKALAKEFVHYQGESIAASREHRHEALERAAGLPVTKVAEPYWD